MPHEIAFFIDPQHVADALYNGRLLHVRIHGDRLQYRKVTTATRGGPTTEAAAKALSNAA